MEVRPKIAIVDRIPARNTHAITEEKSTEEKAANVHVHEHVIVNGFYKMSQNTFPR